MEEVTAFIKQCKHAGGDVSQTSGQPVGLPGKRNKIALNRTQQLTQPNGSPIASGSLAQPRKGVSQLKQTADLKNDFSKGKKVLQIRAKSLIKPPQLTQIIRETMMSSREGGLEELIHTSRDNLALALGEHRSSNEFQVIQLQAFAESYRNSVHEANKNKNIHCSAPEDRKKNPNQRVKDKVSEMQSQLSTLKEQNQTLKLRSSMESGGYSLVLCEGNDSYRFEKSKKSAIERLPKNVTQFEQLKWSSTFQLPRTSHSPVMNFGDAGQSELPKDKTKKSPETFIKLKRGSRKPSLHKGNEQTVAIHSLLNRTADNIQLKEFAQLVTLSDSLKGQTSLDEERHASAPSQSSGDSNHEQQQKMRAVAPSVYHFSKKHLRRSQKANRASPERISQEHPCERVEGAILNTFNTTVGQQRSVQSPLHQELKEVLQSHRSTDRSQKSLCGPVLPNSGKSKQKLAPVFDMIVTHSVMEGDVNGSHEDLHYRDIKSVSEIKPDDEEGRIPSSTIDHSQPAGDLEQRIQQLEGQMYESFLLSQNLKNVTKVGVSLGQSANEAEYSKFANTQLLTMSQDQRVQRSHQHSKAIPSISQTPLELQGDLGEVEIFAGHGDTFLNNQVEDQYSEAASSLEELQNQDTTQKGKTAIGTQEKFISSIQQLKKAMRIKPDFKYINISNRHRLLQTKNSSPKKPLASQGRQGMLLLLKHSSESLPKADLFDQLAFLPTSAMHVLFDHEATEETAKPLKSNLGEFREDDHSKLARKTMSLVGIQREKFDSDFSAERLIRQTLASSRKLSQNVSPQTTLSSSRVVLHNLGVKHSGPAPKETCFEREQQDFNFGINLQQPIDGYQNKASFSEVIKRQVIAAQLAQEKQLAQRQLKAATLMLKKHKAHDSKLFKTSAATSKAFDKKKKSVDCKGMTARSSRTTSTLKNTTGELPSKCLEKLEKRAARSPQTFSKSALAEPADPSHQLKAGKFNNKKEKQKVGAIKADQKIKSDQLWLPAQGFVEGAENHLASSQGISKFGKTRAGVTAKQSYPNYQIKEQTPLVRPKPRDLPQQVINSQKYEQLMAQSFMPELSILERRISELSKMPDQLKFYLQRQKQQQQTGVMSILKPSEERLLLKQKEDKNGTRMLITARNESLARFTKELKQHQVPANKKVMINLSPTAGRDRSSLSALMSPNALSAIAKDSTRKRVNFDLPLITQQCSGPATAAEAPAKFAQAPEP